MWVSRIIFLFLTGIFGINDRKSPVFAKKIHKKFRSHVLNFVIGRPISRRGAAGIRFPSVKDTYPGTSRCQLQPYLRCPLYPQADKRRVFAISLL
jgi:hypothetical protein